MKRQILRIIWVIIIITSFQNANSQVIKGYVASGTNLSQVDGDQAFGFHKFGLNVGLGVDVKISNLFSATLEANYNQKGARRYLFSQGYTLQCNYAEVPIMFNITDDFIRFGVGFSFSSLVGQTKEYEPRHGLPPDHAFIAIYNKTDDMMTYSDFLLQSQAEDKPLAYMNEVVAPWNDANDGFTKNNFNIIADLTFPIWKRLKGNVRYSYSLNPIRKVDYYLYGGVNFDNSKTDYDIYPDGNYADNDFFECFTRKEYHNCISFRLIYYFNEKQVEENKAKELMRQGELQ